MSDHLSPLETRNRARRWRHDARMPRPAYALASGARRSAEEPPPMTTGPVAPHLGPYETAYDLSEGYTTERIILRP